MGDQNAEEVTRLLQSSRSGDASAREALFSRVYQELRAQAHRELRRRNSDTLTLGTTALVHETYLRLVDPQKVMPEDKAHFMALACKIMRGIIVDHARHHAAVKHGGGLRMVTYGDDVAADDYSAQIVALDTALRELERRSVRLCRVVELRFFGGLSVEAAAEALGVTDRTIKRDWRVARALLKREMDNASTV